MQPSTAKINRKHVQRVVILLVVLLAIVYAFFWLTSKHGDPDLLHPPANTIGDIAAIEVKGNGGQAVIIKPDGTIVPSPEYKEGAMDEYVTWRPDGGRLFFESDRDDNQPQIFRWDPDTGTFERRTVDKRAKGFMSFDVPGASAKSSASVALMISGGQVSELDANSGEAHQLLPPHDKDAAQSGQGEEGSQNPMSEAYSPFGASFWRAFYLKDRNLVVAILNREDGGQSLIVQDLTQPKAPPIGVAQAEHIEVTVGQATGQIAFAAQGMEVPDWYPDEVKERFRRGKVIAWPYKHVLALIADPKTPSKFVPIIASDTDKDAFGDPAFSPDESEVAFTVGTYSSDSLKTKVLVTIPARAGAGAASRPIIGGNFSHISWSPDGTKILALALNPKGTHDIFTLSDQTGGNPTNITKGVGDFQEAVFSPQH